MHPLDNIIWNALTTRHAHFAEGNGMARRFQPEVNVLSAFASANDEGYDSLAALLGIGGASGIFIDTPYQPRAGWEWLTGAPLLQMVYQNGHAAPPRAKSNVEFVPLGASDAREMLELTSLTKPGPFGPRTHELGTYLGIRVEGRLAAMAGERLKVPGHTEVSAVCTHPDFLGKGYATALMREIMYRILERGETPVLHVREDNMRAIELYKRLGFQIRKLGHYAILRRRA
jgi:ribosomal protein S18 acetylase RimI-like enzyme